jgi:hypothetical protein
VPRASGLEDPLEPPRVSISEDPREEVPRASGLEDPLEPPRVSGLEDPRDLLRV